MNTQTAKLAAELYDLEILHQSKEFDEAQDRRWADLSTSIITQLRSNNDKRKNIRLEGDAELLFRKGEDTRVCKVMDLSHWGIGVKGEMSRYFRIGDRIFLERYTIGGQQFDSDLPCEIVWKRGRWQAGIKITGIRLQERKNFFNNLYYPLYLQTLCELAQA